MHRNRTFRIACVLLATLVVPQHGVAESPPPIDRALKTAAPTTSSKGGTRTTPGTRTAPAKRVTNNRVEHSTNKAALWRTAIAEREAVIEFKRATVTPAFEVVDGEAIHSQTDATAGLGFGGACCSPEGPNYDCFPNVDEFSCLDGGFGFAGLGSSCSSGICLLRCEEPSCDWCWIFTVAENSCPTAWNGDGSCDCGCQFCDTDCPGCGGGVVTPACCGPNNNVDECLNGLTAAECLSIDGAPQDVNDCGSVGSCIRCVDECDWCWFDTALEGACPLEFLGDGECDCGCQFCDPDCESCGPCCSPSVLVPECIDGIFIDVCLAEAGLFDADAISCADADCLPCAQPNCEWCWVGTTFENNCDPAWEGDGSCDCGCQFCDSDCPECQCPPGPVTFVFPPPGLVDARLPLEPAATAGNAAVLQTFIVRAPAGAADTCWSLCTEGPPAFGNAILFINETAAGRYIIVTQSPLAPNTCTVLAYTDLNGSTSSAFYLVHPGNTNADNFTNANDVAALVGYLNGATPPFGLLSTDIDGSLLATPADIITLINGINGTGDREAWNNTMRPTCGPCLLEP